MDANQIYTIVNEAGAQALGQSNLTVVDTQGLISLGNVVLSSANNVELFINTLAQRIGRTVFSFRAYRNKFDFMVLNSFEYGAILQKIKVRMPIAAEDPSYSLTQGESVDMYTVNKPEVDQKLFVTETPYMFYITIARKLLKEAFLSESAMASFIGYIFGEVQNAIELALENLGRLCMSNFMAESMHVVNLVSEYNAASGTALTAETALKEPDFLRAAMATIKLYSKKFTDMSKLYNDGTETRHTQKEDQRIMIWSDFETMLETTVQYAAFHDEYVKLDGYREINFWQAAETPSSIRISRASDGKEVTLNNIAAFLFDRDALGIYKITEDVLTTPVNAAGSYYNTYWHEKQLWFNDMSENGVVFTLN